MSLTFGSSPWLLLVSVVVAGILSVWLYRRTTPQLPLARRATLGVLRFVALFLICFLLLDPLLRRIDREEQPPIIAVLVDNSESLLVTTRNDTSAAAASARVQDLIQNLPSTVANAELRYFHFGQTLVADSPDSLRFDDQRTDISSALTEVSDLLRDENFRAAVLISDGQFNTGQNPVFTAERYTVPIFTAVVGDTSRHRDVLIRRVTTNEIAYVDTQLPVQVGLRTEDMGGRQVTVSIISDGSVISSQRITLPDGSTEITVDLSVTPQLPGLQRYTVAVTEQPDEVTTRNNRESVAIRVLESKRSVLLAAGAPGPDVAAVRQMVSQDSIFDVDVFVQKDANSFYEGPFPSSVETYDIIILAGFPGRVTNRGITQRIRAAAENGVPLLYLLTPQSDLAQVQNILGEVLPVTVDRLRDAVLEASMIVTPTGQQHAILNIPGAGPDAWRALPPLAYSQSRWVAAPDTDVLATAAVRGVELRDPLLVVRRQSGRRSAALLGSATWRWRNVPEDLSSVDHLWPGLFSNLIQWLTAREDDRPVRVEPVRDLFSGGEPVQFTGQVYDESLNPVPNASLEIEVRAPDGTVSPYVMNPIGNGRYTVEAGALAEGTYQYDATATVGGDILGTDSGAFAVGSLTLEYKETRADVALMRQIAQRSGGAVLDPSNGSGIEALFTSQANLASMVVEHESEHELRRRHIFLAIIVLLLSAEWFIRKRSGMV